MDRQTPVPATYPATTRPFRGGSPENRRRSGWDMHRAHISAGLPHLAHMRHSLYPYSRNPALQYRRHF